MSMEGNGFLHCPLRSFHGCGDGREGSRGFSCLISHLKRQHLGVVERKNEVRGILECDLDVFVAFMEVLTVLRMWLCGRCMSLHALSRECRHPDGSVLAFGEDGGYIVGISRPVMGISEPIVGD